MNQWVAFPDNGRWYKGNIHSHTTLSDGAVEPSEQIKLYKEHGYDFLAFTDHNVMHSRVEWSDKDFLFLPAWERDISLIDKVKCIHVVGLFPADTPLPSSFKRDPGNKLTMTSQNLLDQMNKENVFVSLAHPCWSRMEPDELLNLKRYDAMEVFNTGTECLCHEGHAEYLWDYLLRHGKHVLAIACDDTHSHTEKDDHFGGWTMVHAPNLEREAILTAFKQGKYYSTMGPTIEDWGIEGNTVTITCSPCSEIHFITYPARGKADFGKNLTSMTYELKGGESYLRIEIIDSKGKKAWTNPYWF